MCWKCASKTEFALFKEHLLFLLALSISEKLNGCSLFVEEGDVRHTGLGSDSIGFNF